MDLNQGAELATVGVDPVDTASHDVSEGILQGGGRASIGGDHD